MRVHYWELSNYNNGRLIGRWFDLDGLTKDEHLSEIAEWLAELTEETGELCEEWILGDTEDIPQNFVGTYCLDDELFELIELSERSHLDFEVFLAGMDCGIDLDKIEDAYQGTYANDVDFAENIISDCYNLEEIMGNLAWYFDYEKYSRDLMINDYMESEGHYFSQNW